MDQKRISKHYLKYTIYYLVCITDKLADKFVSHFRVVRVRVRIRIGFFKLLFLSVYCTIMTLRLDHDSQSFHITTKQVKHRQFT